MELERLRGDSHWLYTVASIGRWLSICRREKQRPKRPAQIYVNGRFLQQPVTGIQRYGRELLRVWDGLIERREINPNQLKITVLVPRGKLDPPRLRHIEIARVGRLRGQLWTQLELPVCSKDGLLFSPDNLQPLMSPYLGKSVVTVHDLTFRLFPRAHTTAFRILYGLLIPSAIRNASALVTPSEAEKANLLGHYPKAKDRISVVHLGSPPIEASAPRRRPLRQAQMGSPERYILWVGSLISRKNPQGAIDAAAIVNQEIHLPLVIVGTGHRGMKSTRIKLPASDSVQIPERFTPSEELVALYRSAVCLLFPTFYEGFGLPAVEAMAYGCPVITSDIPVMREVCGDAALYCNPNRPEDIADKVKLLAANAEMQIQLRARGLRRAAQFSWERCARETLQVLQKVIREDDAEGSELAPTFST